MDPPSNEETMAAYSVQRTYILQERAPEEVMNKKTFRRGVITAIWLAALYGAYLLLKHSGFWAQHRWVVVAFCVASGIVCFTRHWREEGDIIVSAVFLVLGGLPFFLLRDGDSEILGISSKPCFSLALG